MTSSPPKIDDLEKSLKKAGLRLTAQRRAILQVMSKTSDHPDAEELHRRVRKIEPGISLPTVYRTIKVLEDCGIVHRHAFDGARARYEHAAADHHDHLIDIDTGDVIEFTSELIEKLQEEVAAKLGYELTSHRLELYGRKQKRPK
ncbi:MAG: Fur family transcriptional regulator [Pseudomonadota bacterium]